MNKKTIWFDAHLDLAWLAVRNRDMNAQLESLLREGRSPPSDMTTWPPAVTLPSLVEGGVRFVMGTLFTSPQLHQDTTTDSESFHPGYLEAAHRCARKQLDWYHDQVKEGSYLEWLHAGEATGDNAGGEIGLILLMENASPIRSPEEVPWWVKQGLSAVGMTWNTSSQYAGGCSTNDGLSAEGRRLVRALDVCRVVHDLSHLNQRSIDELLELGSGAVMASHSNCRVLTGAVDEQASQRHLSDETIREIGRREGMIGLNLYHQFIRYSPDPAHRPEISALLDHVERVCELTGDRRTVGLGSDMDGGFSARDMCAGVEKHADLHHLTDALSGRGWPDLDIEGFTHQNWLRFWGRSGPRRS
jgi:membrane dipeptidase